MKTATQTTTQKQTAKQIALEKDKEAKLFTALCTKHGYTFSDTLPSKDKSMTLMVRGGAITTLKPMYVVRLRVPADSFLGGVIAAGRKERDPRTSKSAVARAKARTKANAK